MGGWPLIGRAEELRIITDAVASPQYQGAAIIGPAGVGKSRLARAAAAAAATHGWAVRTVVGTASARGVPMGAFAEWTDGLDGNPLRVVDQVVDAITATAGDAPLMLVVDDAYLLDDLSAFVLSQLVTRRVATVIATIRSGEPCSDPITGLWKEHHLQRLDLQPLSRPESDELLRTVLADRVESEMSQRMWDLTLGNVLYLRQVVEQERNAGRLTSQDSQWRWDGQVTMTPSLVDLVELQIGSGAEPVLDVLDLVAVAEPLELSCLSAIVDPALIAAAEQRGLVAVTHWAGTDLVRLGHPLYGEVRLARAGQQRRRRLCGRIAAQLAGGPRVDPVRLGLLWLDSDLEPDPAVLTRAAQQSVARLDLVTAEKLARAAADAGGGGAALILHAQMLVLLNQGERAERILDALSRADFPDLGWADVVTLRAANLQWPLGRPDEARLVVEAALADQQSGIVVDHLKAVRAVQLAMAAQPAEAIDVLTGIDLSVLSPLPALVGLWGLTIAHGDLGAAPRAADYAEQGYRLASRATEVTYQGVGLAEFHVCALALAGELGASAAAAERTYQQCLGAPGISRSVATAIKGMAALYSGELVTALACLQPACADFETYGDTTGVFYRFMIVLTEALARSGDLGAANRAMAKMHSSRHPAFTFVEPDALLAEAWIAANRGHVTAAQTLARRGAELAGGRGQYAREVLCLQTAVQFGDTTPETATRLTELAGIVQGPRAAIAARYANAVIRADPDTLWSVSGDLQSMSDQLAAADAAAHAHQGFTQQGRRGPALSAAERVTVIMAEHHAASPTTQATRVPLPLTTREREVATLVADGLSNRHIADTLGSGIRTVEGHVYRACTKLGVSTRNSLAAVINERRPAGPLSRRASGPVSASSLQQKRRSEIDGTRE
jgi:DNA-binding CsgD family transcriptional regulator